MSVALKSLSALPAIHEASEKELRIIEKRKYAETAQSFRVCGGDYRPDPVNKEAAMLLAKAPWWAFAPSDKSNRKGDKVETRKTVNETNAMARNAVVASRGLGCDPRDLIDPDKAIEALLKYAETKYPERIRELARCTLDATAAVKENGCSLIDAMADVERITKDASLMVRTLRMNIVSECSPALNAMRDVRQFFLGPDYDREQKRLSEFVDLCERLKSLKDSGFLDTVADTMIRLASTNKTEDERDL